MNNRLQGLGATETTTPPPEEKKISWLVWAVVATGVYLVFKNRYTFY
jgi:hypothetical protein